MGYRSTVVIALDKRVYTEHFITNTVPKLLQEADEHHSHPEVLYWVINGIKWYDTYPEIEEIERFFIALEDRQHEEDELTTAEQRSNRPLYAAIRMGEDYDDVQEWGEPWAFGIQLERDITFPAISGSKK